MIIAPRQHFLPPPLNEDLVKTDVRNYGKIVVKENVFIGLRVTILPNTTIENNCIIGAGAVVKGFIPAGSVVAGNPAKILCSIQDYKAKCLLNVDKMKWD